MRGPKAVICYLKTYASECKKTQDRFGATFFARFLRFRFFNTLRCLLSFYLCIPYILNSRGAPHAPGWMLDAGRLMLGNGRRKLMLDAGYRSESD